MTTLAVVTQQPPVLVVGPDEQEAVRTHRAKLISETVCWMQHNSDEATRFECTMSTNPEPPRSIRIKFFVARDLSAYGLRFPRTALNTATLWWDPYDRQCWQHLTTFDLSAFPSGQALAEAVVEFLDSNEMYTLHRWLDGD